MVENKCQNTIKTPRSATKPNGAFYESTSLPRYDNFLLNNPFYICIKETN